MPHSGIMKNMSLFICASHLGLSSHMVKAMSFNIDRKPWKHKLCCLSLITRSEIKAGKLVQREYRQEGDVSWSVYWSYVKQLGLVWSFGITLMLVGGQACSVASDWWLAMWSRAGDQADLK